MAYGTGYGSGIPAYQFADDLSAMAARFGALEQAVFGAAPRRPSVGRWALDEDPAGNPVLVNLKTNIQFQIMLVTPGTPLPGS